MTSQLPDGILQHLRVGAAKLDALDRILELEKGFPEQDRFSPRSWRRLLTGPNPVFGLWIKDYLIGVAVYLVRSNSRVARLYSLVLDEDYRGKGYARWLLDITTQALIDRPEIDSIRLEVRASNENAIRLYRSTGFIQIGTKPDYYPDGETALIMQRPIKFVGILQ